MARFRRETNEYISSAGELSRIHPQFKKFKRRKTLKPWEKAWIARTENIYKFTRDLHVVTPKVAKQFPELLYSPVSTIKSGPRQGQKRHHKPIRAIQMANVGDDFKLLGSIEKDLYVIRSNARTWVYWRLPETDPEALEEAGEEAFSDPYTYEIEQVIKLAEQAFARPETKAVYLWAEQGRVGAPFPSLRQFIRWIGEDYSRYENTDRWVRGIVILIGDVDEKISIAEFVSFSPPREPKERVYRKRQRKRRRKWK